MPSRKVLAPIVVILAAGAAFRQLTRPPAIERVILLGFDGAAPNLIAPLFAEGHLPAMRKIAEEGAYGPLRSDRPTKSAILWNSIATGKTMVKHGIVDWTYVNQAGLEVPYQDRKRRVKTYWEILAEKGFKTGTLNWWVTYPPFPIPNGYLVSNAFKARQDPSTVHPQELFASLNELRWHYPEVLPEMARLGLHEWREQDASVPVTNTRPILQSYGFYVAQDLTIDRVGDWLWQNRPVQVFSTYFRLPDVTSHLADHYLERSLYEEAVERERAAAFDTAEEAKLDQAFAEVLRPVYELMDRTIAKYVARMDDRTLLVVCSDHGFRFFEGAYSHANPAQEPPDGVVFLYGRAVKPGASLAGARIYDLAPTILYAMGLPVAEDMDGSVLRAGFRGAYLGRFPVRRIASYESGGRGEAPGASTPEVDTDTMQDLTTLGYIGGASPAPSPTPSPRAR
jgi:hypothetical protein